MSTKEFILFLKDQNISLSLSNDDLKIRSGKGLLPKEILGLIKERKSELVNFLQNRGRSETLRNILQVENKASYPLTHAQQRFWILSQFAESSTVFNMPGFLLLEGVLEKDLLEEALQYVVSRHESLRTVFKEDSSGEVRQYILSVEALGFTPTYIDISNESDPEGKLKVLAREEQLTAFDLSRGPLLGVKLVKVKADLHAFLYTMHHIISDGWSMEVLAKEVITCYNSYKQGQSPQLSPLRIQYKDYAAWQESQLQGEVLLSHEQYWLDQFSGELPVLDLPSDKVRPLVKTYRGSSLQRTLPLQTVQALKELCSKEGATLFMGLLAGLKTLFYRYTGQGDIIVGTPIAGREHSELEDQIGLYLNTLVLRTHLSGSDTFTQVLRKEKEVLLGAYSHQVYPFDMLVEKLNVARDMSRSTLFDVIVALHNQGSVMERDQESGFSGLRLKWLDGIEKEISQFDLSFDFTERGEQIYLSVTYNTDVFGRSRVEALCSHFVQLLTSVSHRCEEQISQVTYLSESERERLLSLKGKRSEPTDKTVIELFEEQVARTPNAIAVVYNEVSLTYKELNERSNELSHYLSEHYSIQTNDLVGLMVDRSEKMLIGLLGILKSGAAYVPLDASYPQDRINYILEDSGVCLLLTDEHTNEQPNSIRKLLIDAIPDNIRLDNPSALITGSSLAYVIYTSGSTGRPKGVSVLHRNASHFFHYVLRQYTQGSAVSLPFIASNAFDISLFQSLTPLLCGGTSVVVDGSGLANLDQFILHLKGVTAIDTVPGIYTTVVNYIVEQKLVGQFDHIERLFIGGDSIADELLNKLSSVFRSATITVTYGPTEGTIFCTDRSYKAGAIGAHNKGSNLGKPISDVSIYILDKESQLLPAGIEGEICIGGPGVAAGYLNQSELTKEKFVSNPFEPGILYRTGDKGLLTEAGDLEFRGRQDDQVKVRGYRIELGEIESSLLKNEKIKEAIVVARQEPESHGKYLAAYIVGEEPIDAILLRAHLAKMHPEYMVPAYIIQLEKLPLTVNGKIDRKALPAPELNGQQYLPASTELEARLVGIWEAVLTKDRIGISDNFFELGGHSLKAMQLMSRIRKELQIRIELKDIFTYNTIRLQASYIEQGSQDLYARIPEVAAQASYPLTHAQQRFWILSQFREGSLSYNMPDLLLLEGTLETRALEKALQYVVSRHESLRTVFKEDSWGEVRQYILPERTVFTPAYIDISGETDAEETLKSFVKEEQLTAFDLSQGPLLRVKLVKVKEDLHAFFYTMHHIISDGWSMEVLGREVVQAYNSYKHGQSPQRSPLRIQYKDYAAWQESQLQGEALLSHEQYWLNQFSGELPVLDLPSDKTRPLVKTHRGSSLQRMLPLQTVQALKELCNKEGATLFMGLLAGLKTLLYRYTGQSDIIVGSPVVGREHSELEDQIGLYLNTLALRTHLSGRDTFTQVLRKEKEVLLGAYSHQVYPFDMLVEKLNVGRDMSRSTLFDVMIVLQNHATANFYNKKSSFEGLRIRGIEGVERETSQYDLNFTFSESDQGLELLIGYNTDVFSRENAERFRMHFEALLTSMVNNPHSAISSLSYLSAEEVHTLVLDFNSTQAEYPREKTIASLFEEQVEKTPDQVALVYEDKRLTYRELNERSNKLAHHLRTTFKIQPDDLIGIMSERSELMIIGLLGILKSGGAYVPIDGSYPKERLRSMVSDSKVKVLLIDSMSMLNELEYFSGEIFALDIQLEGLVANTTNPENVTAADNLAYVMYTSGSTGKAKGVMIEQRGVIRLVKENGYVNLSSEKVLLSTGSFSFDAVTFEYWGMLLNGGRLIVCPQSVLLDHEKLSVLIKTEGVTTMWFTSSWFNQLAEWDHTLFSSLAETLVGGDKLSAYHVKKVKGHYPNLKIINGYGPTENTTFSVCHLIEEEYDSEIPIGRPINNSTAYILGADQELLPAGAKGELYVGGDGVGRGYLNLAELSQEKFIINPYDPRGGRLYKTGDICKYQRNGIIEFIGRTDEQVKIRGYRIELGEIATVLTSQAFVKEAIVIARSQADGSKYIVAYVVGEGHQDVSTLKAKLSLTLPEYMIPAYIVTLEKMPLTANGKVDRKALPDPHQQELGRSKEYQAPRNDIEEKLTRIWQEVLNRENISINDNFFELGGDSIKTIQVSARLRTLGLQLNVTDILQNPVLSNVAKKITATTRQINQGLAEGEVIISPVQHWFLESEKTAKHHFNQSVLLFTPREITADAVRNVFNKLCEHHDSFRLRYTFNKSAWKQEYRNDSPAFALEIFDWQEKNKETALAMMAQAAQQTQSSLDLGQGPLVKLALFKLEDGCRLLIVIHHLVIDAVSWRILFEDISLLFKQCEQRQEFALPVKSDSFKYWMEKQKAYANTEQALREKAFWKHQEQIAIEPLAFDFIGDGDSVESDGIVSFSLSNESTIQLLTIVNKAYNTKINDILLCALAMSLKDVFEKDKVLIALEGHGREDLPEVNVTRTIGWFTIIYPVVLNMNPGGEISDHIVSVKESLRRIASNGIGYGMLRYLSDPENVNDLEFNLAPQISFNYLGQFDDALKTDQGQTLFEFARESKGAEISPLNKRSYALEVGGIVAKGALQININYSVKQFKDTTVIKLLNTYKENLNKIINHCLNIKESQITQSDLGDVEISEEAFKEIFE